MEFQFQVYLIGILNVYSFVNYDDDMFIRYMMMHREMEYEMATIALGQVMTSHQLVLN